MATANESEGPTDKEKMKAKQIKEIKEQQLMEAMIYEKAKMEKLAEEKAFLIRLHSERKEAEEERNLALAKESRGWRLAELMQEDKLAFELDMLKRDDVCELKMRQQIRECPELQELERQLRTAYSQKELMHQIEFNKLRKLEEELKEKEYSDDKDTERLCAEYEKQRVADEARKVKEYREFLQDQIIDKFKAKQEEYKQFLHEKALINDAARAVLEEDRKEEEARILNVKKNREDIKAFIEAKKIWMLKEKQQQEEEDRRIREYLENKFQNEKLLQEKNRIKQEAAAKKQEIISEYLSKITMKSNDLEDMRHMKAVIELTRKAEEEDRKKLENQIRQKFELNTLFRHHMEAKMAKLEEDKRKDLEYSKRQMEQYAEDTKLDMLTAEKRRLREINYRKQLKEEIEERHRRRVVEAQNEISMQELEERARCDRRRLIEEERIRLLQEHASKLVGYLPRGLLRKSDLPLLGTDVQQFYNNT